MIELEMLREYMERHEQCRKELSLWLLEMESKHQTFGRMLDRLREAIVPQ